MSDAPSNQTYGPISLPEIDIEDQQFLHYNPNTSDLVAWVQEYARNAVIADREQREQTR